MRRLTLALCIGLSFPALRGTFVTAQEGTYDENALRLESHPGETRLVRGVSGALVGKIGGFRDVDLAAVVSRSPNAVTEAKVFQRDYAPGLWMISAGLAVLGASIGALRIEDVNPVITTGLTISSVALLGYGSKRLSNAYRALSKSIWWYNRDLVK